MVNTVKKNHRPVDQIIAEMNAIDTDIMNLKITISKSLGALTGKRNSASEEFEAAVADLTRTQFSAMENGCGTAKFDTEFYQIKSVVSKNIKWDQPALKFVAEKIKTGGGNPDDYITYKLSVSEREFQDFPDNIKAEFGPARTMKPSDPKVTYERKK